MSAVLSVFNRNGETVDRQTVALMLAASPDRAVDGQDAWFNGPVALAHQHFWVTPEALGEKQPLIDAAGCRTICADVRLDNRSELIKSLDLSDRDPKKVSDASLILLAYVRWGTACVQKLRGDFAFVIWDADEQHLFAARDALGAHGLCYYADEKCCLVGSEVSQLIAHPALKIRVNEGKIAEFLGGFYQGQEDTFLENINYCPPAHCLLISSESFRKWRYWDVDPQQRIRYKDDCDYAAHYLELLTEVVRCRLRSTGAVGISLSGGLDSTTLAALVSGLLPQADFAQERLKSFSYVFDELSSSDERRFIQPVVDRYQLDATYIPCDDKWTLRDSQDWPVTNGYVLSDPYAWPAQSVMKAARQEGCRLLMTGYYGDFLDAGGRRWAAGMMADLRFGQLAKTLWQQRDFIDLRQDIAFNGLRHMVPQRVRMAYRSTQSQRRKEIHPGLDPDLVERTQLQPRFYIDPARRAHFGPDQWHRYLGLRMNLFAQAISATRAQYNRYGLELSMPYFDRRLVEYVMAIPADQLGRPQRSRWLLRNAASNILPRTVRERRLRTTLHPLKEKGLFVKERDTVDRILDDPYIVKHHYVRADWLRQQPQDGKGLIDRKRSHFLWKCLCLELWLSQLYSPQIRVLTEENSYG